MKLTKETFHLPLGCLQGGLEISLPTGVARGASDEGHHAVVIPEVHRRCRPARIAAHVDGDANSSLLLYYSRA